MWLEVAACAEAGISGVEKLDASSVCKGIPADAIAQNRMHSTSLVCFAGLCLFLNNMYI